jgi:endonuclease/exonuclease/phosphatase family metal-dependent hydrolase
MTPWAEVVHGQSQNTNCSILEDTRLEQKAPDTNYATSSTLYGAGNAVNGSGVQGNMAQAAMRFDCSAIPDGATIQSATLKIQVNFQTNHTYEIFELKKAWTATGATWNNYASSGAVWEVPGAKGATDRGNTVLGSFTAQATGLTSVSLGEAGRTLISGWVNNTISNNGILIRPPLANDDVGFHSRESSTTTTRPVLDVVAADGTPYTLTANADTRLEEKAPITNYSGSTTLYGAGNATNASGVQGNLAEAALKFNMTIPAGTQLKSATLRIHVTAATADTYELFDLKKPWTEAGATWNNYASGAAWEVPGAKGATDRGNIILGAFHGAPAGPKDILLNSDGLALVQGWVDGTPNNGILLRPPLNNDDVGFHSEENTVDPVLEVTWCTSCEGTLRVMQYNTHHGGWTCGLISSGPACPSSPGSYPSGSYNPERIIDVIVGENVDVVSLNEVERQTSWAPTSYTPPLGCPATNDQKALFLCIIQAKTGETWYAYFVAYNGVADGTGRNGNLVLSRYPFVETQPRALPGSRSVALARFTVNTRNITFMSTHLDTTQSNRASEVNDLQLWDDNFAEDKLVLGDFNASSSSSEIQDFLTDYYDEYAHCAAPALPACSRSGVSGGLTRPSSRIDYIFYSRNGTYLTLTSLKTVDTAVSGSDPSDHRPVVATYSVQ